MATKMPIAAASTIWAASSTANILFLTMIGSLLTLAFHPPNERTRGSRNGKARKKNAEKMTLEPGV
jgi:hypothetical protein